jgi:hypothetical protein
MRLDGAWCKLCSGRTTKAQMGRFGPSLQTLSDICTGDIHETANNDSGRHCRTVGARLGWLRSRRPGGAGRQQGQVLRHRQGRAKRCAAGSACAGRSTVDNDPSRGSTWRRAARRSARDDGAEIQNSAMAGGRRSTSPPAPSQHATHACHVRSRQRRRHRPAQPARGARSQRTACHRLARSPQ